MSVASEREGEKHLRGLGECQCSKKESSKRDREAQKQALLHQTVSVERDVGQECVWIKKKKSCI